MTIPMTREVMRGLKAATDEKNRLKDIKDIVSSFYGSAVNRATTTDETSIQLQLRQSTLYDHGQGIKPLLFNTRDKTDIKTHLQVLFPDSSIEYKRLTQGNDGKLYDISTVNQNILPFIHVNQSQEYLVIDWS